MSSPRHHERNSPRAYGWIRATCPCGTVVAMIAELSRQCAVVAVRNQECPTCGRSVAGRYEPDVDDEEDGG